MQPNTTKGLAAGHPRTRPEHAPSNPAPLSGGGGITTVASGPVLPPISQEEQAQKLLLRVQMVDLHTRLRQRNLGKAVLLAIQAERHGGELVDYFCEIGRRYAHLLDGPPPPKLRVVKGGAA